MTAPIRVVREWELVRQAVAEKTTLDRALPRILRSLTSDIESALRRLGFGPSHTKVVTTHLASVVRVSAEEISKSLKR